VLPDQIVDEPLGPLVTPIHLTAENFGTVDKVYIHTAKDQVVSPWLQDQMIAATPVRLAITENTGHTVFISDPVGLAEAIEKVSQ
jgi:pimeloyl-ACP methyl ester carboxylesterase